jgi:hypothetical protein
MIEEKKREKRQEMPVTAAWVDQLRQALGAELVDGAIKAGQQARREYASRVQCYGQQQADEWLARQHFLKGRFWASEGGHEVGISC